jgi:hypothetical protein
MKASNHFAVTAGLWATAVSDRATSIVAPPAQAAAMRSMWRLSVPQQPPITFSRGMLLVRRR